MRFSVTHYCITTFVACRTLSTVVSSAYASDFDSGRCIECVLGDVRDMPHGAYLRVQSAVVCSLCQTGCLGC